MSENKSKVIGIRLKERIITILDEELIAKRHLGENKAEIIRNILFKWLADEGYIDGPPAVMRLLDQVKQLEEEQNKAFLSPGELIELIDNMKSGETLRGIAIKK